VNNIDTYLGIVRVERFEKGQLYDRWFMHFTFESTYDGGMDVRQWSKDYWKSFWDLPNVVYDQFLDGGFDKPIRWPFVKKLEGLSVDRLYLGKWTHGSPFFKNEVWLQYRINI
jgi:hypothetical protein